MAYRLNEDGSILLKDNVAVLKAADDVGKNTLQDILKVASKTDIQSVEVLPLTYDRDQKVWLNIKGKYVLFNLNDTPENLTLVSDYQALFNVDVSPSKDTVVSNVSGGVLTTDGGIPLATAEGNFIDVAKEADVKRAKLK